MGIRPHLISGGVLRKQVKRTCVATVATAAAVALTAGMTTLASADTVSSASTAGAAAPQARQAKSAAEHHITLITGDRVSVDAKGRVVGVQRAKGREHIPVKVRKLDGHTLVLPLDAQRLIAEGKVDQRLFDVTELNTAANRTAQQQGLKVIVGYKGTATAVKDDVRDAGTVRRTLKSLNADAVSTPEQDATELWDAITEDGGTASGVAHIWLDGVREASLDKSVPQIGVPKAWAAGYDGKGVKIAVLDTGVDATHPDLKNQVTAAKNFSTSPDATDKYGHGTHVASIAAGTGAKSNGKYKGVAPGAKILSGKVLGDDGYGEDSAIIAGMEWAAEQGADVVNLSLGGFDTPEVDPLEAEVNKLSKEKGILFAIAAGNNGSEQSIGSPGSAADALTVGAVDGADKLADFSSWGPGLDGAIKPDVTAPGVDITAASAPGSVIATEVGEKPAGYVTISGTSMATPHVAGAAAILKQQHPNWTFAELKGALTGSAKGGAYSAFQQGAGRIQVDKAIKQTVIAETSSVSFGIQQWPHTDDTPVTKQLTYRNLGTAAVTLNLTAKATNPKGQAAPAGFFTLGANKVTVPAGGKASVSLKVNTKLGGTTDGGYSSYVTATGGGQTVRTATAVQREVESYDVKVKYIARDGQQPIHHTELRALAGTEVGRSFAQKGTEATGTIRVPKGTYLLDSVLAKDFDTFEGGVDWLVQPKLSVTKNTTVTIDQRTAKAADITVPDAAAKQISGNISYSYDSEGSGPGMDTDSFQNLRVAHVGPAIASGLSQTWSGTWVKGGATEYDVLTGGKVTKLQGTKVKHYKASDFAKVKANLGASVPGKTGSVTPFGELVDGFSVGLETEQKLPGTRTMYLSTGDNAKWGLDFVQYGGRTPQGYPLMETYYYLGEAQAYKAGKTYSKTFNTAVFGPRLNSWNGVYRTGNQVYADVALFSDGPGHDGGSVYTSAKTTLYRNGTKIVENADPLDGSGEFTLPAGDAAYKLSTSVTRSASVSRTSTKINASWTFRSKKANDAKLPISTARFGASVGLDGRAPADKTVTIPVTVQGAAAGANLKSLAAYVSYDNGAKWTKLTVKNGKVTFKNPAKDKSIAFNAQIADKKGNKSTVTIFNAYYGK